MRKHGAFIAEALATFIALLAWAWLIVASRYPKSKALFIEICREVKI